MWCMKSQISMLDLSNVPIEKIVKSWTYQNQYSCNRLNRIVVERLAGKSRGRRSTTDMPCGLSHDKLQSYSSAKEQGVFCYVTAQLPYLDRTTTFVVGMYHEKFSKSTYFCCLRLKSKSGFVGLLN